MNLPAMSSLWQAMTDHGVPADDITDLASALGIETIDDVQHVFFQNLLARVPRARSDLRHAFISLHNAYLPDDPWDVPADIHSNAEWHQIELHYAVFLLDVLQQNAFV